MLILSLKRAKAVLALLLVLVLSVKPAMAQSILRDAETEAFLQKLSDPLIRAAKLDPKNVEIAIVNDNSINAFVAGGQTVYLNAGLIDAAGSANEVQGVIAHELGHVEGGHVVRFSEGLAPATGISIASLILAAAAIAAGAGDAGVAILSAGSRAAIGKFLAFSRVQEGTADASGARYLSEAGITGKGSVQFFKRLQNLEFRYGIKQEDSYERTHPLSGERISVLEDTYEADPAWNSPLNQEWEEEFKRVKAKLKGYLAEPKVTLQRYPETETSIAGRYARAYAWHKAAYPDKALAEAQALVKQAPDDPYFLELYGQIMLESNRPKESLAALRKATQITNNHPLIAAILGHALIATEDPTNFEEASKVLKAAVAKDNRNPFAWYQLGVVYARQGDEPRAALATAERYLMEGAPQLALPNANVAMNGLKEYTPDWIRAQDIKLVAQEQVEQLGKRGRR